MVKRVRRYAVNLMRNTTLITGGAGFVGTNLADRLLRENRSVLVLDDLSRRGVERNLGWLRDTHGDRVNVEIADIRDASAVRRAVDQASVVYHFAAQVAVTKSLDDPVTDFEINARGTLNVLEALRRRNARDGSAPPLVFTSTNKVYGGLEDVEMIRRATRYEPADASVRARGISEARPLDFHSPYGCSKGAADQYVIDYARTYDLPATVFRMSCIYGQHQHGTEDQGWVAHFLIRLLGGKPITLYGDGLQVRDLLFVEDLVDALLLAERDIETLSGRAFNIGGGAENSASLLEVVRLIGELHGTTPAINFDDWRPGDQRYYVSDSAAFSHATGWTPTTDITTGVARLYEWLRASRERPASARAQIEPRASFATT